MSGYLDFDEGVRAVLQKDKRYRREAYEFVREALEYTRVWTKRREHVTGQQLLEGIRRYALDQFGPMSKTVLNAWGVTKCEDFGTIVFNLIEQKIFSRTSQDSIEDFRDGYDFEEAFEKPFSDH
jgi:uncharacterized repeat protein (TIGR04138 family)